jgi:long-subunit fatty acid transport protein
MCFSQRRARLRRRRRADAGASTARAAAATALAVAVLAAAGGPAAAAPLDEPFIGGMSFDGPTSANLGAVYWNPAALGLVRGFQMMVAANGRLSTVEVNRAPINSADGTPGGTTTFPTARARNLTGPSPFGPNSYFALSTDFGGDRFTIAFATYMPYLQRINFALSPSFDEPTRYQALAIDLRNLLLAPALSIRFGGDFRVGFAPGFLFSTGRLMFAEDLALAGGSAGLASDCNGMPCGAENPAAAARYDVYSGHNISDAKFSLTLGAGLYYRKRSFELGVAYQSRPIGGDVNGVEVAGARTTVTLPPRDMMGGGSVLPCANQQSDRCIFGDISYRLPDVWIAGATWRLRPGLELSAMVRWLWLSVHDKIDIRLSGQPLDTNGRDLPQHVVLWRGFKDVWDTRVRISYWWRERIRVGAMLRLETSAVDSAAVNAAAVDGFKIQPVALIEVRILRQLWLGGGYGITFMPTVEVTDSVFKPELARMCVNQPTDNPPGAGGSLADPACQQGLAGQPRPTAVGRYTARTQDFGVTLTLKF